MTTPIDKGKCDLPPHQRQQRAKDLMEHLERMDPQLKDSPEPLEPCPPPQPPPRTCS